MEHQQTFSLSVPEIRVLKGDITKIPVDAIVNAANSGLLGGGGVDGAIHRAGGPEILKECKVIVRQYGPCPTGSAVITTAGRLPARFVIHTVGPVWRGGHHGEESLLEGCYRESLRLAEQKQLASVSFPAISTGVYGFPKRLAAVVAQRSIASMIQELRSIKTINLVAFDDESHDILSAVFASGFY